MFRLKLFGSASIEGPHGPLTGRPVQRRRLGLLALLALARKPGLTRERLVGYLWPDSDPERARRLLSDSVYRINQALGGEAVLAIGDELRLNPERLSCDVWEFVDAMQAGDWQQAVDRHAAPFLDGFFLTDSDELERWVDAQRERFAREHARALETLAESAERNGSHREAVRWWRALALQDPFSSRIALRLMRALARAGDRAAALRHGREHGARLEEELELAPDGELLAFIDDLRARPPLPGPAPVGPVRSVAVLPFDSVGPEPENEYFAYGVTEDIIAQLAKIGGLRVISRASIMRFRNREESLREVGAMLGVRSLLAGSVRRGGDRVRVVARLVDAETDETLWAETYDRRLTDVFAIQSDVALRIAEALQARLSADETSRIRKEATQDLEAYQLHLKGRHCMVRFTEEGLRQAIGYFERSIERDPDYALAHASIAMAFEELIHTGAVDPDEAYARARDAVTAALALDDELAEAFCMSGHLKAVRDFDWPGAERDFERALELSPSSADTYDFYGRLCSALERHEEAIAMKRRAHELDPMAHRSDLATAILRAGRYHEALQIARQAVEFDPHYDRARATLGWALLRAGREAEGLAALEKAVELSPGNTMWLGQLGQAYAESGRTGRAREILRRLEKLSTDRYVSPYHVAYVYTGLGEHERALDYLEVAYRERAGAVYGIRGSFLLVALHGHPRFVALLERMNLA